MAQPGGASLRAQSKGTIEGHPSPHCRAQSCKGGIRKETDRTTTQGSSEAGNGQLAAAVEEQGREGLGSSRKPRREGG